MTNDASFPKRLMFENHRTRQVPMTFGATFVMPGHGQTALRLENIRPVRIVALNAIHAPFGDGMPLRQTEFSLDPEMARITSRRFFPGIDDELAPAAAYLDMFASGPMTGLATGGSAHCRRLHMDPGVRTGRKYPGDVGMTLRTSLISNKRRSGNLRRRNSRSGKGSARQDEAKRRRDCEATRNKSLQHSVLRQKMRGPESGKTRLRGGGTLRILGDEPVISSPPHADGMKSHLKPQKPGAPSSTFLAAPKKLLVPGMGFPHRNADALSPVTCRRHIGFWVMMARSFHGAG